MANKHTNEVLFTSLADNIKFWTYSFNPTKTSQGTIKNILTISLDPGLLKVFYLETNLLAIYEQSMVKYNLENFKLTTNEKK